MYTIIGILCLTVAWFANQKLRENEGDYYLLIMIVTVLGGALSLIIGLLPIFELIK